MLKVQRRHSLQPPLTAAATHCSRHSLQPPLTAAAQVFHRSRWRSRRGGAALRTMFRSCCQHAARGSLQVFDRKCIRRRLQPPPPRPPFNHRRRYMPHCCRVRGVCDACLQRSQQQVQQPLPSLSQLLPQLPVLPSLSQSMPQLPVQPPPSSGSNRAFQLRNDSGVLVQHNHPPQFSRHFSHSPCRCD